MQRHHWLQRPLQRSQLRHQPRHHQSQKRHQRRPRQPQYRQRRLRQPQRQGHLQVRSLWTAHQRGWSASRCYLRIWATHANHGIFSLKKLNSFLVSFLENSARLNWDHPCFVRKVLVLAYFPFRLSWRLASCSTACVRSAGPAESGQLETMACLDASSCCCFCTWSFVCADLWSIVLSLPPCVWTKACNARRSLRIWSCSPFGGVCSAS